MNGCETVWPRPGWPEAAGTSRRVPCTCSFLTCWPSVCSGAPRKAAPGAAWGTAASLSPLPAGPPDAAGVAPESWSCVQSRVIPTHTETLVLVPQPCSSLYDVQPTRVRTHDGLTPRSALHVVPLLKRCTSLCRTRSHRDFSWISLGIASTITLCPAQDLFCEVPGRSSVRRSSGGAGKGGTEGRRGGKRKGRAGEAGGQARRLLLSRPPLLVPQASRRVSSVVDVTHALLQQRIRGDHRTEGGRHWLSPGPTQHHDAWP